MARDGVNSDDADLVRRAAKGDSAAVMALYDRHSSAVLAVALRVTGRRDEAEEVLQDAFVRVWQEADGFDPARASFRAWVCTIARNRALDLLRRRSTADRLRTGAAEPERPATPENDAAAAEESARVRKALGTLPPAQREAIELAFWKGLTHAEIAEALETPLGTVKTRILDGMRKLKALLDGGAG